MVDAITAVAASAASTSVRAETSLSITSEPDNKWIAARQSQIDADQVATSASHTDPIKARHPQHEDVEEDFPPLFEGHARRRKAREAPEKGSDDEQEDAHFLSGESERIGLTNFDDETPFGDRVAII